MSIDPLSKLNVRAVHSGRLVPQESGRTILTVIEDKTAETNTVEEITRRGRILGSSVYSSYDTEYSITRMIKEYLATHNFWGRRR